MLLRGGRSGDLVMCFGTAKGKQRVQSSKITQCIVSVKSIAARVVERLMNSYRKMLLLRGIFMNMGAVLVAHKVITEAQLQHVLQIQRENLIQKAKSVPMGQLVVSLGYATEKDVIRAVNKHYGLSVSSLGDNIKALLREERRSVLKKLPTPNIPIWLQLSTATACIIVVTILVLSFAMLDRQKEQLYDQVVKIGMVSLNYFAYNAPIPLLEDNILELNTLIKNATDVEGLLYAFIIDQKREIKAHTDSQKIGTAYQELEGTALQSPAKIGDVTCRDYVQSDGTHVLNLSRPITFKDKTLGQVNVGMSIEFIEDLINKGRREIVITALFIVAFALVGAILYGFWFSQPIAKLLIATQEIGRGNYNHRVDLKRKDELGNFARAFNQMSAKLWEHSLVQKSFGKYVGPEVLEMIVSRPENPWMKGHRSEATILFADMRGFTPYAASKEPEEVVEILNDYFEIATRVILDYDGYVDKFIGDAVLGVFGVPVLHEDHCNNALRAAMSIQQELKKCSENGNMLLEKIGIGLDTGIVVAGNIGSQVKMEYTVIGDTVNVASRLGGLAGPGEVVISKNVYDRAADLLEVEKLPLQQIKGKKHPVEIFRVLNIVQEEADASKAD